MKYGIYRLIALLLLMGTMSSCFMNGYGKYHRRAFYKSDRAYWHHKHRHGGW